MSASAGSTEDALTADRLGLSMTPPSLVAGGAHEAGDAEVVGSIATPPSRNVRRADGSSDKGRSFGESRGESSPLRAAGSGAGVSEEKPIASEVPYNTGNLRLEVTRGAAWDGGRPRWANDEVRGLVVDEGQKGTIRGSKVVQDGGLQVALPVRSVAREVQAQTARAERNPS